MRGENNAERNERRHRLRRTHSWWKNVVSYRLSMKEEARDPLQKLSDRERDAIVNLALEKLKESERWAVIEHFVNGRSLSDLAKENSSSAELVKAARKKLEAELQRLNPCRS